MLNSELLAPSKIPETNQNRKHESGDAPRPMDGVIGMDNLGNGTPGGMGTILGSVGMERLQSSRRRLPGKSIISSRPGDGGEPCLSKTVPQYPAIPKAAGIHGTVVLASHDIQKWFDRESQGDQWSTYAPTSSDRCGPYSGGISLIYSMEIRSEK